MCSLGEIRAAQCFLGLSGWEVLRTGLQKKSLSAPGSYVVPSFQWFLRGFIQGLFWLSF